MDANSFSVDENNTIFKRAESFILETNEYIFLTGRAGSGKTTFLHYIKETTKKRTAVAASTAVAAINAGGVTLHSLFQLIPEPYIPNSNFKINNNYRKDKLDIIRKLELLIIDEVSMLRADLLDCIDNTLQTVRKNNLPFGGVQVLFIGDMYQLPPVVKKEEWDILGNYYDSPHFFSAQVIKRINLIYLELKKIYRQKDINFINILNNVRNSTLTNHDIDLLNTRFIENYQNSNQEKPVTLTTHNSEANEINTRELSLLPGKEYTIQGKVEDLFNSNAFPTEIEMHLKEGAQVMLIKNDLDKRYYNGKLAIITKIESPNNSTNLSIEDDFAIYIKLENSDTEICLDPETWDNVTYSYNNESNLLEEKVLGKFIHLPLRLAWAITVHKSQGLTFENLIIDLKRTFTTGQTYVALSRCTSLDGIILLSPISQNCIKTDYKAISFSKSEKSDHEQEQLLEKGKKLFWKQQILKIFDWKDMIAFLYDFESLLSDRKSVYFTDALKLYNNFSKTIEELDHITIKFKNQLNNIFNLDNDREILEKLKERCQKAVEYFCNNIIDNILIPLQDYMENSNIKKRAKVFYKNLICLEKDLIINIKSIMNIQYYSEYIIDISKINIPQRKEFLFSENTNKRISQEPLFKGKKKKEKEEKIDSFQNTLILFKQGLNVEDIAKQRGLTTATIITHLSKFVGREINIEELTDKESFDNIYPVLAPYLTNEKISLKEIYEKLDNKFTYEQIKIVYNYCKNCPDGMPKQKEIIDEEKTYIVTEYFNSQIV